MQIINKKTGEVKQDDRMYETKKQRKERQIDKDGKEIMDPVGVTVSSALNTKRQLEDRMTMVLQKALSRYKVPLPEDFESLEDAMDFDTGEDRELRSPYEINDTEMAYPDEVQEPIETGGENEQPSVEETGENNCM